MYNIATLNKISPIGLAKLTDKYCLCEDVGAATGILVRSQDLHSMEFSKNLLGIARAGAGVNNIPLERCADEGIVVFNSPGANANAVKELVIGALIMSARNLYDSINWACSLNTDVAKSVEKGKSQFAGHEIQGKTLGIIGLGAIGVKVANTCSDLGMRVIGFDPYIGVKAAHDLYPCVEVVSDLKTLLEQCDYLSAHIPAVDGTKGMFNKDIFDSCKKGTVLLNFSRNLLVNEGDLLAAIEEGKIKQYITDFPTDGILCKEGVLALPHLGASTAEAEDNCAIMATEELMDYIENGNITNSVNFPSAALGPVTLEESRIAVMTKGVDNPVNLAIKMFDNAEISAATGGVRGEYGYALLSSKTFIDSVNPLPGVTKVRVIQDM